MLSFLKLARALTEAETRQINAKLEEMGLPAYYTGSSFQPFNPLYRLDTPPRFTVGFRGIRLNQFYLRVIVNPDNPAYPKICEVLNQQQVGYPTGGLFSCSEPINQQITLQF